MTHTGLSTEAVWGVLGTSDLWMRGPQVERTGTTFTVPHPKHAEQYRSMIWVGNAGTLDMHIHPEDYGALAALSRLLGGDDE